MATPVRVLVAGADPEFRELANRRLTRVADIAVIAQVASGPHAVEAAARLKPDVVLLDLCGDSLLATLRILDAEDAPVIGIVVASQHHTDSNGVLHLVQVGASGCLSKAALWPRWVTDVRSLSQGGAALPPRLARRMLETFTAAPRVLSNAATLTNREQEVLYRTVEDECDTDIATKLGVSADTVRTILRTIVAKFRELRPELPGDDPREAQPFDGGVPRRPLPGGLMGTAEAMPEPDPQQVDVRGPTL